jgi:NTP pyrophosphatase (non-canonical NTP hydrolase)
MWYFTSSYIKYINSLYPPQPERQQRFSDNSELAHAALGVAGEAGEVVDLIKKHLAYGSPLDNKRLVLEMGDLVHYVCRIAHLIGSDLDSILKANVAKLQTRYPDGFTEEAAIAQADEKKK